MKLKKNNCAIIISILKILNVFLRIVGHITKFEISKKPGKTLDTLNYAA